MNNNINNNSTMENQIITSYMEFVNTSNRSIHNMIQIINSQQTSFNQILIRNNISSRPSRPSRYIHPYISHYILPNILENNNGQTNHRSNHRTNRRTNHPTNHRTNHRTNDRSNDQSNDESNHRSNASPNVRYGERRSYQRTINPLRRIWRDISFSQILPGNFYEPIVVRPTYQQIESAIEKTKFEMIDEPLNNSCPISQHDFSNNDDVIQLKTCKHIFMPNHILQWFERNVGCPLCRNDIRDNSNNLEIIGSQIHNSNTTPTSTDNSTSNNNHITSEINNNNQDSFSQQLASIISNQLTSDDDFLGNINIELSLHNNSMSE